MAFIGELKVSHGSLCSIPVNAYGWSLERGGHRGQLRGPRERCSTGTISLFTCLLCLGALGACRGAEEAARTTFTVVDSAGFEVVTSHAPAWSGNDAWLVDSRPLVRIGERDGPPELTFANVRATGWLSDGRIFVGDDRSHSVRVFGPQGDYLGTAGREGRGPGELLWFQNVSAYRGDSLYVYDYSQRALTVFAPDLTFARRFTNPTGAGNLWIVSALTDGRFLLASPGRNGLSGGPGLVPDTSMIVVSAPDGSSTDTVGTFETTVQQVGRNGRNDWLFLKPHGVLVAARDRIVWAEGKTFEYVVADPDGTVRRIVRKRHPPVPMNDGIIADFKAHYLEWLTVALVEGTMDQMRQALEEGAYYPVLPATSEDVRVDALGNVWVGHYHFPGAITERWEVFDAAGVWLGSVDTPSGFEVHQIDVEGIIGVAKDELDVPFVEVHWLDRR